ncbi:MAG TPA: D-xylose ABC transporter substrate-binding protein [Terriglobales bacterium]|jgi:D-xylose transport system substrate-binding protein|nr:D-xylose ABC transporter substrate-binding protein [Terriglobales bacterium]
MRFARILLFSVLTCLFLTVPGCKTAGTNTGKNGPIRIGFSMDSLQLERWQRDRDLFVQKAKELGAEVLVQSADGNDSLQVQQAENLLTQDVDVLVIVPHNGEIAASIVDSAKRQHVPVLAYDRIIRDSDVDFYISFDNVKVGELQAQYLLDRAPKGNYVLIGGSPTDNNARLFREGQMNVLKPAVDRGDIKIVADQWAKDWLPSEALRHTENALTQARNNVVAVVASNDSTAGGVIQALEEQKLAGKALVSGQDADLTACQRIVGGTQSMTVYKPIAPLASHAAEIAIALARHSAVEPNGKVNNGSKDVPSFLLTPIAVDKSNMAQTVVKDGFVKIEDVYRNIPRDQWPKIASH